MAESDVRVRASHGSGLPFFRCSYLRHDSEEKYMAESDVRVRASYGSGLPYFPLFLPLSYSWRNHVTYLFPVISTKSPVISGLFVEREKKGRGVKGSSPPVLLLFFVIVIHIWMGHVTGTIESCDRYNWVMSHTYEWVVSHIWLSHVTHMIESWHTCDWVRWHMIESCHTHLNDSCLFVPEPSWTISGENEREREEGEKRGVGGGGQGVMCSVYVC